MKSQVAGSPRGIAVTQANSTHYFQKPGDGEAYDTTRTSLSGDAERLSFERVNGTIQFFEGFTRYSPGFEVNDLGFLTEAGLQRQSTWIGLELVKPTRLYRQLIVNLSQHFQWSTMRMSASDLTDDDAGFSRMRSSRTAGGLTAGSRGTAFFPVFDDRASRGGPALRRLPYTDASFEIDGDPRLRLLPSLGFYAFAPGRPVVGLRHRSVAHLSRVPQLHGHRSHRTSITTRTTINGWTIWSRWRRRYGVHVRAHRSEHRFAHGARGLHADSQLSLQVYAQPFASSGRYTDWRQLSDDPRNDVLQSAIHPLRHAGRAQPSTTSMWPSSTRTSCCGGSIGRDRRSTPCGRRAAPSRTTASAFGNFNVHGSARDLYGIHPDNTFLIKASYWFSL